jgi:acyl-coenzyme A synthetase/AMP-(fatty) acid ligase
VLVAYASMLRLLAFEQAAGHLRITPDLVFSASEVLTGETKRRIDQAWGKQPYDVYAATETAGIAAECQFHTGLHLFEDLVVTEVVDGDNQPVPPGVPDRLAVLLAGAPDAFDDDGLAGRLMHELQSRGALAPQIDVRRLRAIPRTALGKAPLIKKSS